jgi:SAM-dependent methyltransferase
LDISPDSLVAAQKLIQKLKIQNVKFAVGDIFNLPFENASFDHVFVCFVLEHLADPTRALLCLKKVIKKGGTITVIEGDHGSTCFYPDSQAAHRAIQCQVELQRQAGGNALIGREVYPLMKAAGFQKVDVSPRMVYVDSSRPKLVEGFTKKTFTAMIEGVRRAALNAGLMNAGDFDRGIKDLYRTTKPDGVFCYTFFKGVALK